MSSSSIGQQKGSNSPQRCLTACYTNNISKVEWFGLWNVSSYSTFTWPLPNQLPLLQSSQKLFAGKMLSQPARHRKCFPRVHQIPKHGFFFATGTNLFLIGKNGLIVMVLIFINKNVLESSYNDLKFRVQYFYHFCTNLITPNKIKPKRQTLNH